MFRAFTNYYGAASGYDHEAEGRARYRNMADKSVAATRREEQAMKKFQHARQQMEKRGDLVAGTKHTVELLKPSSHLTGACWKSFRKHVLSCEGWMAKRREATAEEKKQHKETRKGKVYFIDVVYGVPKEKQAMKRSVEAALGSSKAGSSGMAFGSGGDADTSSEDDVTAPAEKMSKLNSADTSSDDPEVLDQVKKTKVRRHTDGIAAKIPYAVRRLQDWNNKGRVENRNPNIQAEGDEHLLVGSLRRPDNPEQNTQTPLYNSNSVEDQPLNEYGSPGTSETTPNIGQRSPDVNNGNPEQSLARPVRNLLEKAVESHPNATQPPGTCKSPANCQLQGRKHGVNFSHLARHGITVTPIRSRNNDSNGSGSEEVAGGIHRFQRNQPVIRRDDRASIGQQRNLSVKVVGGDMKVSNGGVTVEMKCTELEIDGPPDDVLKLVTKFKPCFGALQ